MNTIESLRIYGEIKGIKYKPFLSKTLIRFGFDELDGALSKSASFILRVHNENEFAVSWWVSPKRTRSYPYARVYDTLGFSGKKSNNNSYNERRGKRRRQGFPSVGHNIINELIRCVCYYRLLYKSRKKSSV